MLGRQGVGHLPPVGLAGLQIPAADLGKQHVDQIELGDPCGHGTQLQGAFMGAALEGHMGQSRAGGVGKAREQNELDAPLPGLPGGLQQVPCRTGIGEVEDHIPGPGLGNGDGLHMGVAHGEVIPEGGGKQVGALLRHDQSKRSRGSHPAGRPG